MAERRTVAAVVVAIVVLVSLAVPAPPAAAGQVTTVPLQGVVRTASGTPVSAAVVTAVNVAVSPATTDATGAFSFPSIELPVDLDVVAEGYVPTRVRVSRTPVEIFVVASGLAESVIVQAGFQDLSVMRDATSGATWLRADDLRALPAVTLDETLRVVSGFSLFRRSSSRAANPTTHGVTMRGLSASGASRGLVVLDGVPLNDGFGGWVTWTRVPHLALASVEVERGPQGDAFGSDALGGVIRLVPNLWTPMVLSTDLGSHDSGSFDAAMGVRANRRALFGALSLFGTDGTIPVEPSSRGPIDRPTDAAWLNGLARGEIRREPMHLTLTAWGGFDDRGNGTVAQQNRMSGGTFAASVSATVSPSSTLSGRLSVSPNSFEQTFSIVAAGRVSETVNSTQSTDTLATRATVEFAQAMPSSMLFVRGALSRATADFADVRAAGTTSRELRDDSEAFSVHVETLPVHRVTTNAGLRYERRSAPESGSGTDAATIGHVSAAVRLDDRVILRGSVASSHRWPTLNELVRDFQVGAVRTLANPDLEPERAVTAEIGLGYVRSGFASAGVTVFSTVVRDAIANVTLPSLTGIVRQRRNAGETQATGLEIDGQYAFGSAALRGSVTFTDATFETTAEPAIDGNRLPQVPRVSASIWADVPLWRRMRASVFWQGVSNQFDDDRNNFELASASQVGTRFTGPAGPVEWSLSFENLFDNRIEVGRTPLVTLAPGREVRVGVTWRR